jgi:hypothetical protein
LRVFSRFLLIYLNILCWHLRIHNCRTEFYGTMSFNFIDIKESLVYIRIFGVFLVFPPKLFDTSLWNRTLENFSDCSYGRINSISIRINWSLIHIRNLRVISRFLLNILTYFAKIKNIELNDRFLWYYEFQLYGKKRKICLQIDI